MGINNRHSHHFLFIVESKYFVAGVRVLVLFVVIWFIAGRSLVLLAISSIFPKHLSTSSPFTFNPDYTPRKVLLIVMCTLHLSDIELNNVSKSMVVCIVEMSLEWTHMYIKHMSESDLHSSKVRFYRSFSLTHFHVLEWSALWLFRGNQAWHLVYGAICSSKTVTFLWFLKYIVQYLGLALAASLAYDVLNVVKPEEVVILLNPRCISPCRSCLLCPWG